MAGSAGDETIATAPMTGRAVTVTASCTTIGEAPCLIEAGRYKVASSKSGTSFGSRTSEMAVCGAIYNVRQCLPDGPDGDVLYRVKADEELHERIARQTDLVPLAAPKGDAPAPRRVMPRGSTKTSPGVARTQLAAHVGEYR